mgnify:CR=1 FL=1
MESLNQAIEDFKEEASQGRTRGSIMFFSFFLAREIIQRYDVEITEKELQELSQEVDKRLLDLE